MEFGANMKALREQSNMTQAQLAEKAGVTRSLIAQYEIGSKTPTIIVAERIAKVFGVTLNDMVRKVGEDA